MNTSHIRFIPAIIVLLVTWRLSDTPGLQSDFMPALDFVLRKGAHTTIFLLQYLTLFWAILPQKIHTLSNESFHTIHAIAATGTLILALLDEWHQIFVPGRTAQPLDIVYNSFGILIGYGIVFVIWRSQFHSHYLKVKN